ncbi:hypothetical protein ABS71_06015 [bacterium SCN 62-11]|nr:MAG: hypothetical protein ABS71_06015 [bacterium SCN 62-11]
MTKQSRRGATLAEVILSLGLCVVVVLSAVQLALVALHANSKSLDEVSADGLAQQTAESFVYALPPASAGFWTATSFASPYQQDSVTLGQQSYQRVIYVSDYGGVTPGLRSLRVRISWDNGAAGRAGLGTQIAEVNRLVSPP